MSDPARDGEIRRENPTGEPGDGGVEAEEAIETGEASTGDIETDEPPTGHDTFPHP
jgi:hypothetical protein